MTLETARHRRRSIRIKGYDYAQSGAYFTTVCTNGRSCLFGEVVDGQIRLNHAGSIVDETWRAIANHFPRITCDEFVVMPNHVHGILIFDCDASVGAQHAAPLRYVKPGSLGAVIRSFKSAVTRRLNELRNTLGVAVWQRNYHEHIIRDAESLGRIRQYIRDNPAQWAHDRDNPAFVEATQQTLRSNNKDLP